MGVSSSLLALYVLKPVLPLRRFGEGLYLRGRSEGALVTLGELLRRVVMLLAALVLDRIGPRQGRHAPGHLQGEAARQPEDKPAYVSVPRPGRIYHTRDRRDWDLHRSVASVDRGAFRAARDHRQRHRPDQLLLAPARLPGHHGELVVVADQHARSL